MRKSKPESKVKGKKIPITLGKEETDEFYKEVMLPLMLYGFIDTRKVRLPKIMAKIMKAYAYSKEVNDGGIKNARRDN